MSYPNLTRRRFMSAFGVAGALAMTPLDQVLASAPVHHWRGILLGSEVSLSLAHPNKIEANRIFERCVAEIKRLENIFTLYDNRSEVSRLNQDGFIDTPSQDFVDLLIMANKYHEITNGAFDITVQPLWDFYQNGQGTFDTAMVKLGQQNIDITKKRISYKKDGMAITLNGIAQGYITDKITELLKSEGVENVLVELGEKRSLGTHPSGLPWSLGLRHGNQIKDVVPLKDTALATSSIYGQEHIFDPRNGSLASARDSISVQAQTATMADALSTAFLVMDDGEIAQVKKQQSLKIYL